MTILNLDMFPLKNKSIIICKTHGIFKLSHKQGIGCDKCGRLKTETSSQYNQEEVIQKIISIHGNKYGYSKIKYLKSTEKVIIIDKEFNTSHLIATKKTKCTIQNAVNPTDYFVKRAKLIHADRFDYSNTKYQDSSN